MNVQGFLDSLATQTTSIETLRAYRQTIERFEAFLHQKGLRVTQVKPSTIAEFINHLSEHKGRTVGESLAPATIARHLAILSSFFGYLSDNSDGKVRNPLDRVKRPKIHNDLPRAVEDHVLSALVNGITDPRDKALVLLFVYTGLRLSEQRQLDKNTIVTRRRTTPSGQVEHYGYGEVIGKGRKRRTFLVGPIALVAVADYIKRCRTTDSVPALFLSARGSRISCRAIQQVVDKWCKKLELNHIHVHQLRHSFATRNVNAGMSAAVLQTLLGHSNPNTTGRYFRIKSERATREYFSAMEFVNQCSPL